MRRAVFPWLLSALVWAYAGADLFFHATSATALWYALRREIVWLHTFLPGVVNLTALVLATTAACRSVEHRRNRRLGLACGAALAVLLLLLVARFVVRHPPFHFRGSLLELAYLARYPGMLLESGPLFAQVPARTWILCLPTIALGSVALVQWSHRLREWTDPSSGPVVSAPTHLLRWTSAPSAHLIAALVLALLALIPIPSSAVVQPAAAPEVGADEALPSLADFKPTARTATKHFRTRYGFTLERPQVIVIFLLESARSEFVELDRSTYFSHARRAIRVPEFFVPVPHSANSHYSLLTGLHSSRKAEDRFGAIEESMPGALARAGYRTIYLYGGPSDFDNERKMVARLGMRNLDIEDVKRRTNKPALNYWGVDDGVLVEDAKALIAESDQPVFLTIVFTNSHHPYPEVPARSTTRFASDSERNRNRNAIDYAVELSDGLLAHLERQGTSVFAILMADHGESFGEHGFTLHDNSLFNTEIHVPFAMYSSAFESLGEKRVPRGTILDVWPTLADLFDLEAPGPVHGRSLFDPDYRLNLVLRSWASADYTGLIVGDRKWIHSEPEKRLRAYDLHDRELDAIPQEPAQRFVEALTAPDLIHP